MYRDHEWKYCSCMLYGFRLKKFIVLVGEVSLWTVVGGFTGSTVGMNISSRVRVLGIKSLHDTRPLQGSRSPCLFRVKVQGLEGRG